jgi:protein ImuB
MPRFAAVDLPCLRIELAGGGAPRGIVIARSGGVIQCETDLLGATRLDVVSMEARALGIRAGDTIAAARAKCDALRVRVVAEASVETTLSRLAELGLAFGATTSFDVSEDTVWIDVTGCAHLYGGERPLAERLRARILELGHACRVAIADGPRVAAAVARHAPHVRQGPFLVGPGRNAAAMAVLPIHTLPIDDATVRWLRALGIEKVGDLQTLAPNALASRVGDRAAEVMALLRGDDATPLTPYRPPPTLQERAELEYGVESTEALLFVGKSLCDRMAARLEGRAMGALRVDLEVELDRAILREGAAQRETLTVTISSPLVKATDLFAVLRAKIDSYVVSAPVLAVILRVPEVGRIDPRALHLFEPLTTTDTTLVRLAAELSAELGSANVGVLELVDTWVSEKRVRLVPYGTPAPSGPPLVNLRAEPIRFLPIPQKLDAPPPHRKPVVSLEADEWWKHAGATCSRELAMGWVDGALAWLEIDQGTGETWMRGWVD